MVRIREKHPDDRFEASAAKGARYFQCYDCLTKAFRPNISVKAMASHLKDEDHQTLVEARLIRESAAPGATKHQRMVCLPPYPRRVCVLCSNFSSWSSTLGSRNSLPKYTKHIPRTSSFLAGRSNTCIILR